MPHADREPPRLGADVRPGVYRVASLPAGLELLAAAEGDGLTTERIDLSNVATKAAFLAAFARRLAFPAYFGHN